MFWKAGVVAGMFVLSTSTFAYAEDEDGPPPPKYAGSEVSLNHLATYGTFDAGFEQTYNPTVVQSISIDPRWKLTKKISLTGHIGVETELTDSDSSSYNRQPLLDDAYVQASYSLPQLPFLINGSAGVRLTLPTSKASIARETIFAIAPSIALNRNLEISDGITLTPFLSLRANVFLQTEESAQFEAPTISNCSVLDNCDQLNHAGTSSSWMTTTETVGVNAAFPKDISANVTVGWIQNHLYDDSGRAIVAGEEMEFDYNGPRTRYIMLYVMEGSWQPWKHVKLSGGLQTINGQIQADGTYEAPFLNRYTQVYLKGTYVF